jgi:hypothetical protein
MAVDLGALTVRELALAVEGGRLGLEEVRAELAARGPNLEPRTSTAPAREQESAAARARSLLREALELIERARALLGAA